MVGWWWWGHPRWGNKWGKHKERDMTKRPAYKRKHDGLIYPGAGPDEITCDMLCAPFDNAIREMDIKWGIDQLPALAGTEMAEKWAKALNGLNQAISENDPAKVKAWVEVCLRGIKAMDDEATKNNAKRAPMDVWEIEHEGTLYGICRDINSWQAIQKERPELKLVSLREVAISLAALGKTVIAVKDAFPGAEIVAVRKTKSRDGFDPDFGDPIGDL